MNAPASHNLHRAVGGAIVLIVLAYALSLGTGWPQRGTHLVAEQAQREAAAAAEEHHGEEHYQHAAAPPVWMVTPFALLLLAIAVFPLVPALSPWWDSNLHKFYASAGLAALTLLYYLAAHEHPVTAHWPVTFPVEHNPLGPNAAVAGAVLLNAVVYEYVPFIVLLFTLYTIAGGIRIEGDLPARPLTNCGFLAFGAVLANLIGTTGAAMVLIRVLLETNRQRRHVRHTVVFFIFMVCNCGGCLLPLGDPPLFLGYLFGVPFFWTLRLWPEWLFVNGMLLVVYYLVDRLVYWPRETAGDLARDATRTHRLRVAGLWPNAVLLLAVILSIALFDPAKPLPGTSWHPWLFLREAMQLSLVAVSLMFSSFEARRANHFSYHAILEVAALFLGIFVCMQAPLQILQVKGRELGLSDAWHFFWAAGSLSAVLDNAPTYAVFFETARSLGHGTVARMQESRLIAVSLGAVFMGAMTYIGNGPNFMVKTIAEQSGVKMPSFFGYMVYSFLVLLPLFVLITFLFF
jgi:Na+/H+ antiporter NhaD/arsenite permease-like protein